MRARSQKALALLFVLLLPSQSDGERLPIRAYTTADGLAHNVVNRIVRDSRGFLWFATDGGLSRFDGYGFTNFSVEQGLPQRRVMDFLETKSGELWIATLGGLVRFRPDARPETRVAYANDVVGTPPMFTVVVPADREPRASAVTVLLEARDGTIWCGTRKGLFRLNRIGGRLELLPVEIGIPIDQWESGWVSDLLEDRYGSLWVAAVTGLYRRWPDGTAARYARDSVPGTYLHDLFEDRQGRLWVSSRDNGFFRLDIDAGRRAPVVVEHYGFDTGLPTPWVYCVWETSDRRFWVATNLGLLEFMPHRAPAAARFRGYGRQHGLSHSAPNTLAEDGSGNLWLGTETVGAMKLARNGFITYSHLDGVLSAIEIFEDATGTLYMNAVTPGVPSLGPDASNAKAVRAGVDDPIFRWTRLDERRFEWFRPPPPFRLGWTHLTLQTREGEWWIAGEVGVYRYARERSFSRIRTAAPIKLYTMREGLPAATAYRLFEDSRGGVWISTIGAQFGLARWDRHSQMLRDMAGAPGLPSFDDELARSFAEDASGNVWIGFNTGVARYRDGAFAFFSADHGLPAGRIVAMHPDRAGRLWLGSSEGGLIRVDRCDADSPVFATYTTAQGLSANTVDVITEDLYGRIYAATGSGIDQLDPQAGRIRRLGADDGLPPGVISAAFRDRTGTLWFGSIGGLSRFIPAPPSSSEPPRILITGLVVAGEARQVSAIGESEVALPDLRYDGNQVDISFVALGVAPGEYVRYQYRFDDSNSDWSRPTTRRSISYASLSPGRYRFLVRAVNADGTTSSQPAVVAFAVLPPFWQRWWFVSLAALAVAASAVALHRYRLSRALELERVRTRIATDLHDDIGANLTRIAILSEVARQQPRDGNGRLDAPLSSIATIARESVTSMSDIVWAISPERDTLHEVVRRMRDHAEEVFEARDVAVEFDLPDAAQTMKLGVDVRRDLYLIFKEAVNNSARHSACLRVTIVLRIAGSHFLLEVSDDGVGFDTHVQGDGNGLASMARRARRLGASLDVRTRPGVGTTVRLTMPIEAAHVSAPARLGR